MARALFTSKKRLLEVFTRRGIRSMTDARPGYQGATAPNFLLAKERLKPGWTGRWLLDPARISPGTSMPSGLFQATRPITTL